MVHVFNFIIITFMIKDRILLNMAKWSMVKRRILIGSQVAQIL